MGKRKLKREVREWRHIANTRNQACNKAIERADSLERMFWRTTKIGVKWHRRALRYQRDMAAYHDAYDQAAKDLTDSKVGESSARIGCLHTVGELQERIAALEGQLRQVVAAHDDGVAYYRQRLGEYVTKANNARRWSAAWKRAAKTERQERLMYTRQDVKLDYAHFEPGNLQAMLEHPVFQVISQTMWEMLEAAPAPNYIEWQMRPRDEQGEGHDIVLTAQRCEGKTPHTCRKEAEAATKTANERIATLEGLLRRWDGWAPIVKDSLLHDATGAALAPAATAETPTQAPHASREARDA